METQITWKINSIEAKPTDGSYENVITLAHWSCVGANGTHCSSRYGCCTFSSPGENFTPYEELTEEQILEWCFGAILCKDAVEESIKDDIFKLINPPTVKVNLPWIKKEPENTVTENTETEPENTVTENTETETENTETETENTETENIEIETENTETETENTILTV